MEALQDADGDQRVVKKELGNGYDCSLKSEEIDIKEESIEPVQGPSNKEKRQEERRGHFQSRSPDLKSKKQGLKVKEKVIVVDEFKYDNSAVLLDWHNSDLNLLINKEIWHGGRATYGFTRGRIFYEVKVLDCLPVPHLEEDEQRPHEVRVGWSGDEAGLKLGEDPFSYGYGGTGKASSNLKFKDYGKTFGKGDIVGCYLDLESEPVVMSFTVNGENQGMAYEISRSTLGGRALFPHIVAKNCSFKVNFGTEEPWSTPLTRYTYVGHIALPDRVLGGQGPATREEAEIRSVMAKRIMSLGVNRINESLNELENNWEDNVEVDDVSDDEREKTVVIDEGELLEEEDLDNPEIVSLESRKGEEEISVSVSSVVAPTTPTPPSRDPLEDSDDPLEDKFRTSVEMRSRKRRRGELHPAKGTPIRHIEEVVRGCDGTLWHQGQAGHPHSHRSFSVSAMSRGPASRSRSPSPLSVGFFYSRRRRPDDYEGDEFSEDSVDDSDIDRTYVQEDISEDSEEDSECVLGSDGGSEDDQVLGEGVPSTASAAAIQRCTPSPILRSRTPSPTSWLHARSKRRGRVSPLFHATDDSDGDAPPLSSVSPTPSPTPPPTRGRRIRRPSLHTSRRRAGMGARVGRRPAARDVRSADLGWQWTDGEDFVPHTFDFDDSLSGIQVVDFDKCNRESDFFNYFWNNAIIGLIMEETNRFFYFMKAGHIMSEHSREQQWYDVTLGEMRIFLALVMLMGIVRKGNYRDYWSTDPLLHTPFFSKAMSVNRFTNILRALHFCDNLQGYTTGVIGKITKICAVFDHIRNRCKEVFYPFQNVVIDESLVLWRRNISFKQYIPSKRHRFGLKLFVLCDCKTGFVQDLMLYTGAETEVTHNKALGVSGSIVATLMESYLDKNHVLYVDKYYTSPALFEYLFSRQTGACGSARKRRRNMPNVPPIVRRGETVYRQTNNILSVYWRDKQEVIFLTSVHNPTMLISQNVDRRSRQRIPKPECIVDYNVNMRLVDKSDTMISSIDCARKTLKWYKKLFFHLLDITMLDSQILFTFKHQKKCTLPDFVVEVIRQLLEDNAIERPAPGRRSSAGDPTRLSARHFIRTMPVPPGYKKRRVQRACFVCRHTKRRPPQRKDTRFHCRECDVPLCVEPCFEEYHTRQNF